MTIDGVEKLLDRLEPRPTLADFYAALVRTSEKIAEETVHTHAEVSSPLRFARALVELASVDTRPDQGDIALEFATRHMTGLATAVVCPPGRQQLLRRLGTRFRLGLVSNFDFEPTARALLDSFGLAPLLETALISDAEGVRKPAARIFHAACRQLGTAPERCVYVGDSRTSDVEGASAAGLAAVWVNAGDEDPAPAFASISDVDGLPELFERRYGIRFDP